MKRKITTLLITICCSMSLMAQFIVDNPDIVDGIWYNLLLNPLSGPDYIAQVTYYDGNWDNNQQYATKIDIPPFILHDAYVGDDYVPYLRYEVILIGSHAFWGASQITRITLPSCIESIGSHAFYGCTGLQSIIIPDSVKEIYTEAFAGCTGLQSITCLALTPPNMSSTDIFDGVDKSIPLYVHVGTVKNYRSAKCWNQFDSIVPMTDAGQFGNNLTWSWNLEKRTLTITGTDTMPDYSNSADVPWADCQKFIEHIVVANGVTSIGNYAFANCPNLVSVSIGKDVTYIGKYAFHKCTKLPQFDIPDNVVEIDDYAFALCESIMNFYIGKNVRKISSQAFYSTIVDTINWNVQYLDNDYSNDDSPFRGGWTKVVNFGNDVEKIPNYLFFNNKKIEEVSYGTNISNIGRRVFDGSTAVKSIYWNIRDIQIEEPSSSQSLKRNYIALAEGGQITFGPNVINIPNYFIGILLESGTENLTSITIPDNVKKIGKSAFNFYWCKNLKHITIGNGVEEIREQAFYGAKIRKIIIPDNVKIIGDSAFGWCDSLKYLTLGNGVEDIGEQAFSGNRLLSVTIPDNVKKIGIRAFSWCDSLEHITIGSGVEEIREQAFYGAKIRKIIIPDNVKIIGESAFWSDSLSVAYIGSGIDSISNPFLYSSVVMDTIYWNVRQILHNGYEWHGGFRGILPICKHLVFGSNVNVIPDILVVENSFLRELSIPDNVEIVEGGAFMGCDSIERIEVGKNVKYISLPLGSISRAVMWNAIDYPDDSRSPFESFKWQETPEELTITIGENVHRIPKLFCNGLKDLKHLHISNGVKIIGDEAFANCISLTSLFVPESVDSIGHYAFGALPNIEYYGNAEGDKWGARCRNGFVDGYFVYGDKEKTQLMACSNVASGDIVIPDHVTYIQEETFYERDKISSITIPGSVTIIPRNAFWLCYQLKNVVLHEGVQRIEDGAFAHCDSLSFISLPSSLQNIAPYAFDYTHLEKIPENWDNGIMYLGQWLIKTTEDLNGDVIVRDNTQGIAEYAFRSTDVTSIILPQSIKWIGNDAFRGCYSLNSINLPESLSKIGKYTFSYCTNLSSINIPRDVKEIGEQAFYGCENLKAVYLDDIKAWCDIDFGYNGNPLLNTGNLYLNGTLITNLIIPEGVKQLRWQTFLNDTNLISVVIPSSLDTIDGDTFEGCNNIKRVIWNAENCRGQHYDQYYNHPGPFNSARDSIVEFVFGEKVTRIPADLCKEMEKLDTIRLPKSVEIIEETAFKECYLSAVICEAETPPTLIIDDYEESPFAYSQNDLYVPATSIKAYRESAIWKNFYNIYPIGLNPAIPTNVDSTTITVLDGGEIVIYWKTIKNARRYEIKILENNEVTVYSLTFDPEGHLTDYTNNSGRKLVHNTTAELETNGWRFTIDGLKPLTYYTYSVTAYDYKDKMLSEDIGSFVIQGTTNINNTEQDIKSCKQKLLRNGQVFILHGDKTYTLTGQEVK